MAAAAVDERGGERATCAHAPPASAPASLDAVGTTILGTAAAAYVKCGTAAAARGGVGGPRLHAPSTYPLLINESSAEVVLEDPQLEDPQLEDAQLSTSHDASAASM